MRGEVVGNTRTGHTDGVSLTETAVATRYKG